MADLIYRDAVLHDVSTELSNAHEAKYYEAQVALTRAKRIICAAPAVNRWIPCSERLPYGGRVLATTKQGYVVDVIFVAKGSQWYRNGEHFAPDAVIAWQPMPDAYEPPESEAQHDE